jgi:hypothetical protein
VIDETPWKDIEAKFGSTLERGSRRVHAGQGVQPFAGMLATFCAKIGWHKLELLIKRVPTPRIARRPPEMMDLMEVGVKPHIARLLFDAGLKTPEMLADSTARPRGEHPVENLPRRLLRRTPRDETILTRTTQRASSDAPDGPCKTSATGSSPKPASSTATTADNGRRWDTRLMDQHVQMP